MRKPGRARLLADEVADRLRQEIIEGEFQMGEALSEAKIALRYGVSRTPVREGFACLGLEGLVHTAPQLGTFVFTMDQEEFNQISQVRSIWETAALRLVMTSNPEGLAAQWARLLASMEAALQAGQGKRYAAFDGQFHQALFDLAENPYLTASGHSFAAKIATVRTRQGAHPDHMKKSFREHSDLLACVQRNAMEEACTLLDYHIRVKGESFWT